jgi:hypothetical protein
MHLLSLQAPGSALSRHLERVAVVGLLLSTLLILHLTLEPYTFQFGATLAERTPGALLRDFLDGVVDTSDVINNYVLFMPFGWSVACLLHRRVSPLAVFSAALLCGAALSLSVEMAQAFLPSRTSSVVDVRSNSLGSLLGWGAWALAGLWISSWQRLAAGLSIYLVIALAAIPMVPFDTSLQTWDRSYRLHVGNEETGDRPWLGELSHLLIAERALPESVLRSVSLSGEWPPDAGPGLLADYVPAGAGMVDRTGQQPALIPVSDAGEELWLATDGATRQLSDRLAASSQFTLVATVQTTSTDQSGPARIVSLSQNTSLRNFTLAQDGTDLVLRVRSPLTGQNGTWPEFRARGVFSTTEPQRLAIAYTGQEIRLAVNGALHPDMVQFTYAWALVRQIVPPEVYVGLIDLLPLLSAFATALPNLICLALIGLPAGLLLAIVAAHLAPGRPWALAVGGAAAIGVVLWASFVLAGGRVGLDNMAGALLILGGAFALFRLRAGQPREPTIN